MWFLRPSLRALVQAGSDRAERRAIAIMNQLRMMEMDLTRITKEVEELRSVADGVVNTLGTVSHAIRQYKTDQVALEKLADDIDAQSNRIAQAITANTDVEGDQGNGGTVSGGERGEDGAVTGSGDGETGRDTGGENGVPVATFGEGENR